MSHLGEAAGVLTAALWSFTAIFFTLGTRRVGALAVNQVRLALAVVLLGATHGFLTGDLLPAGAGPDRWIWLGISGVVGLSVGDSFLFAALDALGPRKSMLIMATSPILTAILGLALFGESLTLAQVGGISLTVAGVTWVVLEKGTPSAGVVKERLLAGVLLGLGASVCQSLGLLAAKRGMVGEFPALGATLLRMVAACAVLWLAAALRGKMGRTWSVLRKDPGALLFIGAGGITGPYLGVWMSLFSVAHAKVGVAATLMALVPIFLIPITRVVFGERPTARAVGGTVAAFAGSALLFWN